MIQLESISKGYGGLAALQAEGAYIAFAAAPGQLASDNPNEPNGLFTKHLKAVLAEPGLSIDDVFSEVRQRVFRESANGQRPYSTTGLIGRFYFHSGKAAVPLAQAQAEPSITPIPAAAPVAAPVPPDFVSPEAERRTAVPGQSSFDSGGNPRVPRTRARRLTTGRATLGANLKPDGGLVLVTDLITGGPAARPVASC